MKRIHVAIGSTMSRPGNVAANLKEIAGFARSASEVGADVLLTPELSASGYGSFPEVIATAEPAGKGRIYDSLAKLAHTTGVTICAGFVEAADGKRYLCHYVVYPNGRFVVQRKNRVTLTERPLEPAVALTGHPPGASDPADPGQPVGRPKLRFFDIRGVRCAITICADSGLINVNGILQRNRVELVLAPAGAGGKRKDRVVTKDLKTERGRKKYIEWLERAFFPGCAVTDCLQYRRAFAAVNQCGYDGKLHHHLGHGMIINPMGEVVGFFHGLPNLDRQRPMFAHAVVDVEDRVPR
jgi:predicted amidohydrolase